MKYSELIKELEYWKAISGEDDPEIVICDEEVNEYPIEIESITPVKGIDNAVAIGIKGYLE